tara:strand:+ start:488 stop:658 length:171 start_codon:yes stop_codon:yes gene_type:complete
MEDYKITNYRKANGVRIYTLWKNDKIIASSSDYNKIADYKFANVYINKIKLKNRIK